MERVFLLIGIINQLATTRINRALKKLDLPYAQFTLLSHLSNDPERGWTVTRLAEVMEVNQPAMTKTTQRLWKKGCIEIKPGDRDKRIRTVFVTSKGLDLLAKAWGDFAPDVGEIFSDWQREDVEILKGLLERLKSQLDESRD